VVSFDERGATLVCPISAGLVDDERRGV